MPTPTGHENINGAVAFGRNFCFDETHGYSMTDRMLPDVDCSSFVGYCLQQNGFDVSMSWNTTTMIPTLQAYPGFTEYHFTNSYTPQHGDIFVYDEGGGANGHTFFYAENVIGYTDGNADSDATGLLSRARVEASSSRGHTQTGDHRKNGTGAYWEVWVHPWSAPDPNEHYWHVFRWGGASGTVPPWLLMKYAQKMHNGSRINRHFF